MQNTNKTWVVLGVAVLVIGAFYLGSFNGQKGEAITGLQSTTPNSMNGGICEGNNGSGFYWGTMVNGVCEPNTATPAAPASSPESLDASGKILTPPNETATAIIKALNSATYKDFESAKSGKSMTRAFSEIGQVGSGQLQGFVQGFGCNGNGSSYMWSGGSWYYWSSNGWAYSYFNTTGGTPNCNSWIGAI